MSPTTILALAAGAGLGFVYPWLEPWQFWACLAALAGVIAIEEVSE